MNNEIISLAIPKFITLTKQVHIRSMIRLLVRRVRAIRGGNGLFGHAQPLARRDQLSLGRKCRQHRYKCAFQLILFATIEHPMIIGSQSSLALLTIFHICSERRGTRARLMKWNLIRNMMALTIFRINNGRVFKLQQHAEMVSLG